MPVELKPSIVLRVSEVLCPLQLLEVANITMNETHIKMHRSIHFWNKISTLAFVCYFKDHGNFCKLSIGDKKKLKYLRALFMVDCSLRHLINLSYS